MLTFYFVEVCAFSAYTILCYFVEVVPFVLVCSTLIPVSLPKLCALIVVKYSCTFLLPNIPPPPLSQSNALMLECSVNTSYCWFLMCALLRTGSQEFGP